MMILKKKIELSQIWKNFFEGDKIIDNFFSTSIEMRIPMLPSFFTQITDENIY